MNWSREYFNRTHSFNGRAHARLSGTTWPLGSVLGCRPCPCSSICSPQSLLPTQIKPQCPPGCIFPTAFKCPSCRKEQQTTPAKRCSKISQLSSLPAPPPKIYKQEAALEPSRSSRFGLLRGSDNTKPFGQCSCPWEHRRCRPELPPVPARLIFRHFLRRHR